MAVDWGARRIGLALSDPTRTIASPLRVIEHQSRALDDMGLPRGKRKGHFDAIAAVLFLQTYLDNNQ
jgi:RNase H-fold protein (predicted Holliday junction resolvase)